MILRVVKRKSEVSSEVLFGEIKIKEIFYTGKHFIIYV